MNLEPTPETELASAALDDQLSEVELKRVHGDEAFVAQLRSYEAIQNQLRTVDVPAAARESGITAALAAFDTLQLPPEDATNQESAGATTISSLDTRRQRRQRQYRLIGTVAATAMIAVAGIAVLNRSQPTDSKASTSAAVATKEVAPAAAPPELQTTTGTESASAEDQFSTNAVADTAAATPESAPSDLTYIGGAAEVSAWVGAPNIASEEELKSFLAADPSATSDDRTVAGTGLVPTCLADLAEALLPVIYQGQEVFVSVDPTDGSIRVINPTTCTITTVIQP